jgi:hypothetical protein
MAPQQLLVMAVMAQLLLSLDLRSLMQVVVALALILLEGYLLVV